MEAGGGAGYVRLGLAVPGHLALAAVGPRGAHTDCRLNAFPSHMLPVYMHAVQIGIPLAKNDLVAKQFLGQILGKVETVSHCQILSEVCIHLNTYVESTQLIDFPIALYNIVCLRRWGRMSEPTVTPHLVVMYVYLLYISGWTPHNE